MDIYVKLTHQNQTVVLDSIIHSFIIEVYFFFQPGWTAWLFWVVNLMCTHYAPFNLQRVVMTNTILVTKAIPWINLCHLDNEFFILIFVGICETNCSCETRKRTKSLTSYKFSELRVSSHSEQRINLKNSSLLVM